LKRKASAHSAFSVDILDRNGKLGQQLTPISRRQLTMEEFESFLKTVGDGLRALAQGIGAIANKLDNLADAQADEKPKRKVRKQKTAVKTATKTTTPGKKATKAVDVVYKAISSSKKGVDLATLAKKTGFEKRKIQNAIYRLKKQGKVRSVAKGVYMKM